VYLENENINSKARNDQKKFKRSFFFFQNFGLIDLEFAKFWNESGSEKTKPKKLVDLK